MEPLYLLLAINYQNSLSAIDYHNKFEEYLILGAYFRVPFFVNEARRFCFISFNGLLPHYSLKKVNFLL